MSTILCSISKNSDPKQTKIWRNFQELKKFSSSIELNLIYNNTKIGLSEHYNSCIEKYSNSFDYIVLVHDDVEFINMDLEYQIECGMKQFDVLGVAGCVNPQIKDANLWHLMASRTDLRGFAGHPMQHVENDFFVTSFGPTPSRVAMIDGVVMILKSKKVLETGARFDINYRFHHYDLDFSLTCNKNKLKIGVWPILINHSSPGLREVTEDWKNSNERFKNKWIKISH